MNRFRSPRAAVTAAAPVPSAGATATKPKALAAVLLAATMLLTGCSAPDDDDDGGNGGNGGNGTAAPGELTGTLTVFAAASLQESFRNIAGKFETENPDVTVRLNFSGSSDLATQIVAGAPADVFASADVRTMDRLADEGLLAAEPDLFATNILMIAVPPGNPADVTTFADLGQPDIKVVLCAPQVPCGAAAAAAEDATGTDIAPVSEESSVTDVMGKVVTGQADAGLVYVTDVAAAKDTVEGIAFPEATATAGARNSYPIAAVKDGHSDVADAFTALVTGPEGQRILDSYGFGSPQ